MANVQTKPTDYYEDFVLKFIRTDPPEEEIYQVHVIKTPVEATGGVINLSFYPAISWQGTINYVNTNLSKLYEETAYSEPGRDGNSNDIELLNINNSRDYANKRTKFNQLLRQIGLKIYDTLPFDARKALVGAFKLTQRQGKRLRIGLDLTEASGLYALPWELLFQAARSQFFALSNYTPVVRMVATPTLPRSFNSLTLPLKVLIVLIATKSEDVLSMPDELHNIKKAFAPLETLGQARLDLLDGVVTFDRFRKQVKENCYQIIHFITHGNWDSARERATLQFHAPGPETSLELEIQKVVKLPTHAYTAEDFSLVLGENESLEMVFLNSCEAGRASAEEDISLSNMSAGLVKNGVPAVIALQELASPEAAVLWSTELYNHLVRNKSIEEAVTESRKEVYMASQHNVSYLGQWFVPVLYKATELAEEPPPWYVQVETSIVRALRRLGTDRSQRGSAGLLAIVIVGTLMVQYAIEKIIPADPTWKEFFLNNFNLFFSINPANPIWLHYFLNVYLWLVGVAFFLVIGVTLWAYTDLKQEPILGKLERGGRLYLLMLVFIGANLGLLTGLTLCFIGSGLLLYYTGLFDLLPIWTQVFVRCLTGFCCVVTMAVFARRIPLSSKTASYNFKPVPAEIFIAASLFLVVLVILFAVLFVAPAIFLNKPLGGIFIGVVLFILYLWESHKAVGPVTQKKDDQTKPNSNDHTF